jgi:hypothetical protein
MRSILISLVTTVLLAGVGFAEDSTHCTNATLHGSYGFSITGSRPNPSNPSQFELVVGTAVTNFDGQGNFTQTDNVHGQFFGYIPDRAGSGTYTLNPDCSGTMWLENDGAPFKLVLSIVVVNAGKEVRAAVVGVSHTLGGEISAVPPIMVTSNGRRME